MRNPCVVAVLTVSFFSNPLSFRIASTARRAPLGLIFKRSAMIRYETTSCDSDTSRSKFHTSHCCFERGIDASSRRSVPGTPSRRSVPGTPSRRSVLGEVQTVCTGCPGSTLGTPSRRSVPGTPSRRSVSGMGFSGTAGEGGDVRSNSPRVFGLITRG